MWLQLHQEMRSEQGLVARTIDPLSSLDPHLYDDEEVAYEAVDDPDDNQDILSNDVIELQNSRTRLPSLTNQDG